MDQHDLEFIPLVTYAGTCINGNQVYCFVRDMAGAYTWSVQIRDALGYTDTMAGVQGSFDGAYDACTLAVCEMLEAQGDKEDGDL